MTPDRYEAVRPALQSGDVLCFSGKGRASDAIKYFTGSPISHVGMVLRVADLVLCWESTTLDDGSPSLDPVHPDGGVQLVPLSDRVARYPGGIWARRVAAPRGPGVDGILAAYRREVRGRPYERSWLELMRAAYDGPGGRNDADPGRLLTLFCSEHVCEALQRLGWLPGPHEPGGQPAAEYVPRDLWVGGQAAAAFRVPLGPPEPLNDLAATDTAPS